MGVNQCKSGRLNFDPRCNPYMYSILRSTISALNHLPFSEIFFFFLFLIRSMTLYYNDFRWPCYSCAYHTSMYRAPEFGNEGPGVQTPFSGERVRTCGNRIQTSRYPHMYVHTYVFMHADLSSWGTWNYGQERGVMCQDDNDDYVCLPNLSPMIIAVRRIIYTTSYYWTFIIS